MKLNLNRAKKLLLLVLLLFFMGMLIAFPERYTESFLFAVKLWAVAVLPTLLPFFFLTQLLTLTNAFSGLFTRATKISKPLFKCSGLSVYAFLMSILSGYPVGSRIVYDLKKAELIDKYEATKIAVLASTSGPLFVIGAVGINMFFNKTVGVIIFISHVLSAFINGLIFRNYGKSSTAKLVSPSFENQDNILYNSIYNSVISVLIVGGFITVFFVFASILQDVKLLLPLEKLFELILAPLGGSSDIAKAFSLGLVECTSGVNMLSKFSSTRLCASLSSALISFGGISIIMQSLIFLQKAEVKTGVFISAKLLQTVFSFMICYFLLSLSN